MTVIHCGNLNQSLSILKQQTRFYFIMFRKTIQNIQTARTNINPSTYNPSEQQLNAYNTQRHDRYPPSQQIKNNQPRKNPSSAQFRQLKKFNENKTSELVIRECDVNELPYKKPPIRVIEEVTNVYHQYGGNSSNKKERIPRKTYETSFNNNNAKQTSLLEELYYQEREHNTSSHSSSQNNSQVGGYFEQQIQCIKQYMFQLYHQQSISIKSLQSEVKSIQIQCMGELENFANQISRELNKQKDDMIGINKRGIQTQRQLRHFRDSFNQFVKDNEEKIESIVLDMNGINNKKSRAGGEEFGVELKSSTHCISGGVGTSMSVNLQNQNINLKLYNQMSAQLQILKNQLELCKEKIQLLEKQTKILQNSALPAQSPTIKDQKQKEGEKIDLQQVEKLIIQKFSEDRKKNSFNQKIQELDLKSKDLYKVYQDMDSNIKGMNAEFTRVINGTVIKKEKMLQARMNVVEEKINEINQKLSTQQLQEIVKTEIGPEIKRLLQDKSSSIKVIKLREQTAQEKLKLSVTRDNPQYTYMIDEEGYLLDMVGNYISETKQNGVKQRVKVEKNWLYLLETQGLEVRNLG